MSTKYSCRCCGELNPRLYLLHKGFQLDKCGVCEFIQVRNLPEDEELHKIYEDLHKQHVLFRSRKSAEIENQRRLKLIRQFTMQGASLLDAGCGGGDFLSLASEFYDVHGVDISIEAINAAQKRLPLFSSQLISCKLEDFQSNGRTWDVVCCWDMIEHAKEPHLVMERLVNAVKPGGFLILSTPDVASLVARVLRKRWAFLIPPYHLSYFSQNTLSKTINKHGQFECIKYQNQGKLVSLPFFAYKLNQMAPYIFPKWLAHRLANGNFSNLHLYVPTNDILYAVYKKL